MLAATGSYWWLLVVAGGCWLLAVGWRCSLSVCECSEHVLAWRYVPTHVCISTTRSFVRSFVRVLPSLLSSVHAQVLGCGRFYPTDSRFGHVHPPSKCVSYHPWFGFYVTPCNIGVAKFRILTFIRPLLKSVIAMYVWLTARTPSDPDLQAPPIIRHIVRIPRPHPPGVGRVDR